MGTTTTIKAQPQQPSEDSLVHAKIGDRSIWGIYIALLIISIIESYSASSREIVSTGLGIYMPIIKHILMLGAGAVVLFLLQRTHYRKFIPFIAVFAFITIIFMIIALFIGDNINGAKRSFTIMGISIQPAEMAKLSIVALIAWIMARSQMEKGVKTVGLAWSAFFVMVYGGLLFQQGLTNTILLMSISLSMMVIGGVQWRKLGTTILIYMLFAGGLLGLKMMNDEKEDMMKAAKTEMVAQDGSDDTTAPAQSGRGSTWAARLDRFTSSKPLVEQPLNSINQQEIFARMAQAHGGVTGVGPGNSRECSRLPLAFSDYIYSIIIEETGVVGGIFVLFLYLCLLARAGLIAKKCSRAFPALLIMGMAVMVTFQAMFHMAINTGLFPVSGQPLPLISRGGTSILITSMAFGVMISVSRFAVQNNKSKDIKSEASQLPENLRASNPVQID